MGCLVRGWHGNTGQPASASATATSSIGRPASPSRAAVKSPSMQRGAFAGASAGAMRARAVMGLSGLAFLRLRGARVDPLPDRGPLKAELPLPDPRERDEAAVYEFVNPGRPQVEIGRDLDRSPHTMHPDEDGPPRDSRTGVGFAG